MTPAGFLQRHACFDVFFTSDSTEGALATILALGTGRMAPMSSILALFSAYTALAPEHLRACT